MSEKEPRKPICPLLSIANPELERFEFCREEGCSYWEPNEKACVLVVMARALSTMGSHVAGVGFK